MRHAQLSPAFFGGALLLAGMSSCRSATEITLTIRTNVACEEVEKWQGIAVYLGKPGAEATDQAPTLVTKHCVGEGEVGSLVVVPSGEKDDAVGVRVVAGIGRDPEDCLANDYQGCIVARRAVRFTPHADLALDVVLTSDCESVGCDATRSCTAKVCVPTTAPPAGAPPTDGLAPGVSSVRCGDDGLFCPTSGDVCCLSVDVEAQRAHGTCMRAERCRDIVLNCDDDSDCPPGGYDNAWSGICMLSTSDSGDPYRPTKVTLSSCRIANLESTQTPAGLALCEDKNTCAGGQFTCNESAKDSNLLPGYHWCHFGFQ